MSSRVVHWCDRCGQYKDINDLTNFVWGSPSEALRWIDDPADNIKLCLGCKKNINDILLRKVTQYKDAPAKGFDQLYSPVDL